MEKSRQTSGNRNSAKHTVSYTSKRHRRIVTVMAVLLSVILIAAYSFPFFVGSAVGNQQNMASQQNSQQTLQSQIKDLKKQLEANPEDKTLQKKLADTYFNLGIVQDQEGLAEAQKSYQAAVEAYQAILANSEQDVNVLLELAIAAYYSGDIVLAEQTYQQAIAIQPDSYDVLYNYGLFLAEVKNDYAGAIENWEKALTNLPATQSAEKLNSLISQAKQLQSEQAGTSQNGQGG